MMTVLSAIISMHAVVASSTTSNMKYRETLRTHIQMLSVHSDDTDLHIHPGAFRLHLLL